MSIRRSLAPLAIPVTLLGLLTACSPAQGGSPPPKGSAVTGAEHTLRFQVGPSGSIAAPVAMKATKGADVKLKLDNRSARRYTLRVTGPSGEKRAAVAVAGHHLGQTNFVFTRTGTYVLGVYRGAAGSPQREFPLKVRAG